jgi:hypothetical protein
LASDFAVTLNPSTARKTWKLHVYEDKDRSIARHIRLPNFHRISDVHPEATGA